MDTNAISAAADEEPALTTALSAAGQIFLPVIALGEYRAGIRRSRHREKYKAWLEGLITDCTVLDIQGETSWFYASLVEELKLIGRLIPTNDMWIAALCRQHKLPLLSRDQHFDHVVGLRRISW